MSMKWFTISFCMLLSITSSLAANKGLYGFEDRKEFHQITSSAWIKKSEFTAGMIDKGNLTIKEDGFFYLQSKLLSNIKLDILGDFVERPLCSGEKFMNSPVATDCSGVLVAPDLILTAGHCAFFNSQCNDNYWVFNYKYYSKEQTQIVFKKSEVFGCKKIINTKNVNDLDYSLIQLDGFVDWMEIPKLNFEVKVLKSTKVTNIGHPLGLPLKFTPGGKVTDFEDAFHFITNLDVFHGSSGSPVYSSTTKYLLGIVTSGDDDFEHDVVNDCLLVKKYPYNGGEGEEVLAISSMKDIKPLVEDSFLRFNTLKKSSD